MNNVPLPGNAGSADAWRTERCDVSYSTFIKTTWLRIPIHLCVAISLTTCSLQEVASDFKPLSGVEVEQWIKEGDLLHDLITVPVRNRRSHLNSTDGSEDREGALGAGDNVPTAAFSQLCTLFRRYPHSLLISFELYSWVLSLETDLPHYRRLRQLEGKPMSTAEMNDLFDRSISLTVSMYGHMRSLCASVDNRVGVSTPVHSLAPAW